MHMIRLNHYLRGERVVNTADLVRSCAQSLEKLADSMDKPNELFAMFNELFDVVSREKVADKLAEHADALIVLAADLRGEVVDERPNGHARR